MMDWNGAIQYMGPGGLLVGLICLIGLLGVLFWLLHSIYVALRYPRLFYAKWKWFQFGHRRWPIDAINCAVDSTLREAHSRRDWV